MSKRTSIDWEQLARQLGTIHEGSESSDSIVALQAIELLIGEKQLRDSVDYYISQAPGCELARVVLWQLHPWPAMQRCYEIFRLSENILDRQLAIELLRVVADRRALKWIDEFIIDPDPGVQNWGAGVLDQLLWSELVEVEECRELLDKLGNHESEDIREKAQFIRSYLKMRAESEEKETN